jgi:transcriptional regulator with XRE-family HTH domain
MFNGDRLKLLREEKKMTQEELAKLFNVTDATINRYEKNQRQPDTDALNRFADFFDVTTDYLLGRTDKRKFNDDDLIFGIDEQMIKIKLTDDIKKRLKEKVLKAFEE